MKTYNMNFIPEKKEYWVCADKIDDFIVVFKEKSVAHQYKLSLTLGSVIGPWDSVEGYELVSSSEGTFHYKVKDIKNDDQWDEEPCCQSGCPGCPWTLSQE